MSNRLKMYLVNALRELSGRPIDRLLDERYAKFRNMGVFFEGQPGAEAFGVAT
jgi:acetyl-CoA carboxylase alpha subunit